LPSNEILVSSDPATPQQGLVRSLSLTQAVLYGLGVTIGAGIYVLVGVMADRSGMHAPLAFLVAAIPMALSAASFAELGTRMPVSASEAAYVQAAFDRRWVSLSVGLLVVATATISAATIASGSAGYIASFVGWSDFWIIAGVVLAMGAVSCLATTQSVTFAGLMTVIEISGLLAIIGAGLMMGEAPLERLPGLVPSPGDAAAWVSVLGSSLVAVFAFLGFEHLVNISEELKEPTRTLPRALFLTLGITAALYFVVVWIAVVAVPPVELGASEAPLALVFERLTGFPLATMSAVAIVATLNGVVVHMIMIARVLYGMARQGFLPSRLGTVSSVTGTPLVATGIGVVAILALAVALSLGGLADLAARGTLVIFAVINLALLKIKREEASAPDHVFVCPVWVPVVGFASTVALLVADFAL
jgi:amino acid transporter